MRKREKKGRKEGGGVADWKEDQLWIQESNARGRLGIERPPQEIMSEKLVVIPRRFEDKIILVESERSGGVVSHTFIQSISNHNYP